MIVKQLINSIFHFEFKSREDLCRTLIRFQEYYESPKFQNQIFTLGQFREWYTAEYGAFTYYSDWSGFNIPDFAFKPFLKGRFDPLTRDEERVVEVLNFVEAPYYVIATSVEDNTPADTLKHELCHALYYLSDKYKLAVQNVLRAYDLRELKSTLAEMGYSESVLEDECNAYLTVDSKHLKDELNFEAPEGIVETLNNLYDAHSAGM